MARRAALVSLAFLLVGNGWSPLGGCLARIKKVSVDERGVTAVLVSEAFGMAAGGRIKFDVDLNYDQDEEDLAPSYIVVVAKSKTTPWYETMLKDPTSLGDDDPPQICMSPSSGRFEVTESASFNMTVGHHDVYTAYLLVCQSGGSFAGDVTANFVNLNPEGDLSQHLPIEFVMNPSTYSVISVIYVGMLVVWAVEIWRLKPYVLKVHYLCLLCLFIKGAEAALVAAYFHRQNVVGENQEALRMVAVLFENLSRAVLLLTLLLLSLGWGFVRPVLRVKEIWVVGITMGLYGAVSMIEAGCLSQTSRMCRGVALMEYTLRSLIMLSTVVAINFNITHIRFCIQLPWTSSSTLEYLKLSRYLSFRLTFLAYLLMPTVLLIVQITVLSWEYEWVSSALEEFVTVIIYACLGVTFAPFDPWLLTRAFDHSLEEEDS